MRVLTLFPFAALVLFYACPSLLQCAPHQASATRASATVHAQELAMPPKAARAFEKGCALLHKHELQASLVYFYKAIELAPNLFPAYYNLALAQYTLGRLDDAAQNFQKAIDLSKGSFAASFFGLSVVFYTRGQFTEAERIAQQGLVLAPGSALGKYCLGLAQYSLGRTADAQRSTIEALRINPGLADAYLLLAHVHERLHDPNAVVADVDSYLKNTSSDDLRVRADAIALRQRAQRDLVRASVE